MACFNPNRVAMKNEGRLIPPAIEPTCLNVLARGSATMATTRFQSPPLRMAMCAALALQLLFWEVSESMGNHDSEIVDASSVD
jgi:hypothetical protein